IAIFANFRLWKAFTRWRKVIRCSKVEQCRRFLEENLFIANSSLRPALLNVREMCYRIGDMGLCKLERGRTYTLLEFLTSQVNQLNEVFTRLGEFRELVKEVVRSACRLRFLLRPGLINTSSETRIRETERILHIAMNALHYLSLILAGGAD
ncbi:unnamed protein product, partial [Protopolystoma xenopodis]